MGNIGLVVSRKKGEGVTIEVGDVKIHVVIVEQRGDKVRLGFQAPPEAKILRDELIERQVWPS